jgi:thiamine pyrophosphokinase
MSSHHIVREKQEPALYIHHFGNFDEEYLGQLLEWSPTLLVASSEYEKAVSLGLKVDVVIGKQENLQIQENTKWIFSPTESLQATVKYLIAEKYPAVNIIGLDNKFDGIADLIAEIDIVLFTPILKNYPIKTGFSVWKPAGTVFKIDIISYFETSNLKPTTDGSFEVIADGFVSFTFATDYLFLSELL